MRRLVKYIWLKLVVVVLAATALSSCAASAVSPVSGIYYSNVKAPLTATSNAKATKVGTATCTSILGAVAMGDCSIQTAAESAGITKIHHIDYESQNLLGIFATFKVIVYGE